MVSQIHLTESHLSKADSSNPPFRLMGTNCAPLVADLFLFFYERDFMMSHSDDKQADVIDAFYTTSTYLDDILNINNVYFDNMVSQIYPSELAGPRSAVGNVSGYRCVSDCRSRGREFDPGPVPYFRGD